MSFILLCLCVSLVLGEFLENFRLDIRIVMGRMISWVMLSYCNLNLKKDIVLDFVIINIFISNLNKDR